MKEKIYLKRDGIDVKGEYFSDGISEKVTIFAGSKIRDNFAISMTDKNRELKEKIITDKDKMDNYIFKEDYEFSSLSEAASVCLGNNENGRKVFKLEKNDKEIRTIFSVDFIEYVKENLELNKYHHYLDLAERERENFIKRFPLKNLPNLPIEKYDELQNPETFTRLMEHKTAHVCSGFLGDNKNKIFYQSSKSHQYEIQNSYKKDNEEKETEELYKDYINNCYEFVKNFDKNNYVADSFIPGNNIIKINLILLYKGPIITGISKKERAMQILEYLNIPIDEREDSVSLNIKLSNYLYENIPEIGNCSLYEVTPIVHEFIKENLESHNYYVGGFTIDNKNRMQDMIDNKVFAIGWEYLGNLKEYDNNNEIIEKLIEIDNKTNPREFKTILNNLKGMKQGDIILLKSSSIAEKKIEIYAKGEVTADFDEGYDFKPELGHTISVKWEEIYKKPIVYGKNYPKTLQKVNDPARLIFLLERIEKEQEDDSQIDSEEKYKEFHGENIIYYGVPGCGKSSLLEKKSKNYDFARRILFHPEYSYNDFVGQILPIINEENKSITYEYEPGPFTKILAEALNNKEQNYLLIIEEINRGNTSAIFGDIFQLLDRYKTGEQKGESEFPIRNDNIKKALIKLGVEESEIEEKDIYIPNNLTIIATMNSSDQNVFTLDTAFKRRWHFKRITNEFQDSDPINFRETKIDGTEIKWEDFVITINNKIAEFSEFGINGEDKQIGKFFVSEDELKDNEKFAEKVLLYLWEDVVKYDRTLLFKKDYKTLGQLINGFKNYGEKVFQDGIFNKEINEEEE